MQRMQKALTQMNLQLANVISDISGLTGQAILRAITAGERDAGKLAELRDPRIKASPEEIAKSLQGNWRPELLFVLQQELEMYDTYQRRIAECDQQLQKHLAQFTDNALPTRPKAEPTGKKTKPAKNAPRFDLRSEMQRITGVDLTRIDGIDVMVAQTILSEVGFDMTRWKTEAHFASWLGLCPDNQISGDKVLARGTRRVVSRVATALRMAAITLMRSRTYLGAQYRRLRTRLGAPKAITAMAHRLARLVYRMLKYGQSYIDKGSEYYEQRYRNQQLHMLRKQAAKLGLQITASGSSMSSWRGDVKRKHFSLRGSRGISLTSSPFRRAGVVATRSSSVVFISALRHSSLAEATQAERWSRQAGQPWFYLRLAVQPRPAMAFLGYPREHTVARETWSASGGHAA